MEQMKVVVFLRERKQGAGHGEEHMLGQLLESTKGASSDNN
jgi:hypothetical protein